MFYAPFIVLIVGIVVAFVVAPMDGAVRKQIEDEKWEKGRRLEGVCFFVVELIIERSVLARPYRIEVRPKACLRAHN